MERPGCTGRGHWVPGAQGAAESGKPQNLYPGLGLDTYFARLPEGLLPPSTVHALHPWLEKVCGTGVLEARECGTKSEGSGLLMGLARRRVGQERVPGGRPPAAQPGRWHLGPLRPAEPPPLWLLVSLLPASRASLGKLIRAEQGGLGPDPTSCLGTRAATKGSLPPAPDPAAGRRALALSVHQSVFALVGATFSTTELRVGVAPTLRNPNEWFQVPAVLLGHFANCRI